MKHPGWHLSEIRKFRLIHDELTKVHRGNMEIVSYMRHVLKHGWQDKIQNEAWNCYWSGVGKCTIQDPMTFPDPTVVGELWEWIVEGRLELVGALEEPYKPK